MDRRKEWEHWRSEGRQRESNLLTPPMASCAWPVPFAFATAVDGLLTGTWAELLGVTLLLESLAAANRLFSAAEIDFEVGSPLPFARELGGAPFSAFGGMLMFEGWWWWFYDGNFGMERSEGQTGCVRGEEVIFLGSGRRRKRERMIIAVGGCVSEQVRVSC